MVHSGVRIDTISLRVLLFGSQQAEQNQPNLSRFFKKIIHRSAHAPLA
jgi:hypothetical protein